MSGSPEKVTRRTRSSVESIRGGSAQTPRISVRMSKQGTSFWADMLFDSLRCAVQAWIVKGPGFLHDAQQMQALTSSSLKRRRDGCAEAMDGSFCNIGLYSLPACSCTRTSSLLSSRKTLSLCATAFGLCESPCVAKSSVRGGQAGSLAGSLALRLSHRTFTAGRQRPLVACKAQTCPVSLKKPHRRDAEEVVLLAKVATSLGALIGQPKQQQPRTARHSIHSNACARTERGDARNRPTTPWLRVGSLNGRSGDQPTVLLPAFWPTVVITSLRFSARQTPQTCRRVKMCVSRCCSCGWPCTALSSPKRHDWFFVLSSRLEFHVLPSLMLLKSSFSLEL
ncbi:hypothetical protein IE81DRAFT_41687 [Ceraceosorus guamensis]|uniref:Uncharacterized protein n=1 Tax=Ceraceosorus guamensis TaxID=1522189 RepID=A0A316VS28_9BASI|nr:hypothetical protein IE81DRAFT_41687 [Ceraceosorus guamensis]PWN39213.1 hypothetical protein IE81DRAFT_41687 [Ceraceosorus guamensis]